LADFGYFSDVETCQPVTINDHCWGANSIVYCSCDGGQVLKLDTESMILVLLVNPQASNESEDNKTEYTIAPEDGSSDCIAVNKTSIAIGDKVYMYCMAYEQHCTAICLVLTGFIGWFCSMYILGFIKEEVLRTFASVLEQLKV
jgi:hypothetical protein